MSIHYYRKPDYHQMLLLKYSLIQNCGLFSTLVITHILKLLNTTPKMTKNNKTFERYSLNFKFIHKIINSRNCLPFQQKFYFGSNQSSDKCTCSNDTHFYYDENVNSIYHARVRQRCSCEGSCTSNQLNCPKASVAGHLTLRLLHKAVSIVIYHFLDE